MTSCPSLQYAIPQIAKSNEGTQEKNGGVKGTNMNAEELDRESLMSRLPWAVHIERMADERLPKRAAELEVWF